MITELPTAEELCRMMAETEEVWVDRPEPYDRWCLAAEPDMQCSHIGDCPTHLKFKVRFVDGSERDVGLVELRTKFKRI